MMKQAVLLVVVALQIQVASSSGVNLVPHWQFDGAPSTWVDQSVYTSLSSEVAAEHVVWTDGRIVRSLKCVEEHHGGCYPCWAVSKLIRINPSLAYEFSIYIQSTGRDVANFFGFFAYDCNANKIAGAWTNPYFKTSRDDGLRWKRWNGYILPSYIPDSNNDGFADMKSHESNGADWVWPSNACYVRVRFGSCFGNGLGMDQTWFVFPSVNEATPRLTMLAEHFNDLSSTLRTFDIGSPEDWSIKPLVGGTAFVNDQYTKVHRSVESGRNCYNWAVSQKFQINHKQQYEFSIWITSTERDMRNYLGFYAYNQSGVLITTGSIVNPYFKTSNNDPSTWVRWNGFILPSTVPSSPTDPNRPKKDPRYFSKGVSWKWPSDAVYVAIRFGSCYADGDNEGITYYALPQVLQSDLQL